ncbi:ATP-binding protein [Hahella sp. CR1]|uniref:hybrid sensor histidine kinase/response regulator transcription factor n=1 Tax=Hahella sp. CR1 TaxID=2992807 RepID=UPI0024436934|nr:hybrid sensor histidine kinase/response regulator transcription factor [Hahella sp. CR1]MDG9670639.1 ATP-binding protein [Hahella sp. CR1]
MVLLAAPCAVAKNAPLVTLRFNQLTVNDKLNTNAISAMYVDERYVWLATYNGVSRYDGVSVVNYLNRWDQPESLFDDLTTRVFKDSRGDIWVCSAGAVNRYSPREDQFHPFPFSEAGRDVVKDAVCDGFYEDEAGNIWLGSSKGLFVLRNRTQMEWIESTEGYYIKDILQRDEHSLWLASFRSGTGLYVFDLDTQEMRRIPVATKVKDDFSAGMLQYQDDGALWVGSTGDGVFTLTTDANGQEQLTRTLAGRGLHDAWITDILHHGSDIWIATRNEGLYRLTADGETQRMVFATPNDSRNTHKEVFDIQIDDEGVLWIVTFDGLYYGEIRTDAFNKNAILGYKYIEGAIISSFAETDEALWIGTMGRGLLKVGHDRNVDHLVQNSAPAPLLFSDSIRAMQADHRDSLWIATDGGAQFLPKGAVQFQPVRDATDKPVKRYASTLTIDSLDHIWVGYQSSVAVYDGGGKQIALFDRDADIANGPVLAMTEDRQQRMWIGSLGGGLGYASLDLQSFGGLPKDSFAGEPYSGAVYAIHADTAPDRLWLGTQKGLQLVDVAERKLLNSDAAVANLGLVISMRPYGDNVLWLATEKALHQFSMLDGTILTTYGPEDGLQEGSFIRGANYVSHAGEIYFGGKQGLNLFRPEQTHHNEFKPRPLAEATFYDENSDETLTLPHYSPASLSLKLPNALDNVTFKLGGSSRADSSKNRFRLQLLGYDQRPKELPAGTDVFRYTNLPSGHYEVKAQASNNSGVWGEAQTLYRFDIAPPMWMRWYAWIFYASAQGLLVYAIVRWRSGYIQRKNARLQALVTEKTHEIESQRQVLEQTLTYKEDLLENISHELKTPLTLMLGVLAGAKAESDKTAKLHTLVRRTGLLLDTMQELSRSKQPQSSPQPDYFYPAHEFVEFYFTTYASFVSPERLRLIHNAPAIVHCAPDTLDKVITNLVNNAIKYSSPDTPVEVHAETIDGYWRFCVSNQGKGIRQEQLESIFERYVQLGDTHQSYGLGLGLPLVKALVEQAQGEIRIESEPHGQTRAMVTLPIATAVATESIKSIVDDHAINPEYIAWIGMEYEASVAPSPVQHEPADTSDKALVYCIDDNQALLNQLHEQLSGDFQVRCFINPEEALQQANLEIPDLIISDVMMPQLTGIELIETIRSQELISHIPVILLTAKSDRQSERAGLLALADDYITKPYDPGLLALKAETLINIRTLLKARFQVQAVLEDKPDLSAETGCDDKPQPSRFQIILHECAPNQREFLNRVIQHMQNGLSDPEFNVLELSGRLHLSESQVRRKVKAITGFTPQEILRMIRLEAAAELLQQGAILKVVALDTGFSSQSHMGSAFKTYFGVTPKQYQDERYEKVVSD